MKYGLTVARYAGLVAAILPTLAFFFFHYMGWLPMGDVLFRRDFIFCGVMTIFLQMWTATLFFRNPVGEQTYFALAPRPDSKNQKLQCKPYLRMKNRVWSPRSVRLTSQRSLGTLFKHPQAEKRDFAIGQLQ